MHTLCAQAADLPGCLSELYLTYVCIGCIMHAFIWPSFCVKTRMNGSGHCINSYQRCLLCTLQLSSISLCHLQKKSKPHSRLLRLIRLPHNVVCAPYVVRQVIYHALAHVWFASCDRKRNGLTRAHKSCIKRPAGHPDWGSLLPLRPWSSSCSLQVPG